MKDSNRHAFPGAEARFAGEFRHLRGSGLSGVLVILTVALTLAGIFATGARDADASLRRVQLGRLCQKSDSISCGVVVDLKCYRAPYLGHGEIIFTDVTLRITDRISGKFRGDTVTIQVPGGRIGEEFTYCANAPSYKKGEKVLVFLRPYNGRVWNTAWSHGKYRLRESGNDKSVEVLVEGRKDCPISKTEKLSEIRKRILSNGGARR